MSGLVVTDFALIPTTIFKLGEVDVVDNAPVNAPLYDSNYRDHHVGSRTKVWGWKAAVRRAQQAGA